MQFAENKTIHLIGIGGVGMAALAVLLKARGAVVSGCDLGLTPRTRWLAAQGIPVFVGHDPAHLADVDEVIVTPAVAADNPERRAAVCPRSRGEVLAALVSAAPDAVAVCGSHGKTTTATWIARLLLALGESVEWAIGGETGDFPVAGRLPAEAKAPVLVVEADESDGTLALYRARTLVVTNCEYDHPDHFPTPADYLACYETAKRQAADVIESGTLDVPDWPVLRTLAPHNRRNARTAVEVARRRGHDLATILAALPEVVAQLPDRRFQPLADGVYTDYAHHPTEMACAVAMARRACRGTLRVLFQPHRYSRTKALMGSFPAAFQEADEVWICPTYAAFEKPVPGGDSMDLWRAVRTTGAATGAWRAGEAVRLAVSCTSAWAEASSAMRPGDVTLILGAGDIIALAPAIRAIRTDVRSDG